MCYKAYFICILFWLHPTAKLFAQSVLYSTFIQNPTTTSFEVVGKAGNFYWVQKSKKNSSYKRRPASEPHVKAYNFEIYDARLNRIRSLSCTLSDTVLKQYLIAGPNYFDQLLFAAASGKTYVLLNRFNADGTPVLDKDTLLAFPGSLKGNDFLLVRSQDQTKLLLLGFEPVEDAPPRLHAVLYNSNWHVLFQTVYTKSVISQPYLQYDFSDYPLEHYDNSPVKLANNGDWLFVAPSRRSNNYLLCHFHYADSLLFQSEIKLAQHANVQQVSLTLDNVTNEASAGLLLNTYSGTIKKVQTAHYLLSQCHLDFDTTYRVNTLGSGQTKEAHLVEHYFMPLSVRGFLFLKEYGRSFVSIYQSEEVKPDDEIEESHSEQNTAPFHKNDYTRYTNFSATRRAYERGDLSLYYFPAKQQDSSWSGLINQAQTGELNSSFLSYRCVPLEGKIILLYNSLGNFETKFASTTFLDAQGHSLNKGIIFWQSNNRLDFQKARQISINELAVPYARNGNEGFAVIRMR